MHCLDSTSRQMEALRQENAQLQIANGNLQAENESLRNMNMNLVHQVQTLTRTSELNHCKMLFFRGLVLELTSGNRYRLAPSIRQSLFDIYGSEEFPMCNNANCKNFSGFSLRLCYDCLLKLGLEIKLSTINGEFSLPEIFQTIWNNEEFMVVTKYQGMNLNVHGSLQISKTSFAQNM